MKNDVFVSRWAGLKGTPAQRDPGGPSGRHAPVCGSDRGRVGGHSGHCEQEVSQAVYFPMIFCSLRLLHYFRN